MKKMVLIFCFFYFFCSIPTIFAANTTSSEASKWQKLTGLVSRKEFYVDTNTYRFDGTGVEVLIQGEMVDVRTDFVRIKFFPKSKKIIFTDLGGRRRKEKEKKEITERLLRCLMGELQ